MPAPDPEFPKIRDVGLSGLLVSFAGGLSEGANRAALAFRAAVEDDRIDGVEETATTLVSTFLRYDPLRLPRDDLTARLREMLGARDWTAAPLPGGRTHWRIPTTLGGTTGPQFAEAADLAGLSQADATRQIAEARLRVLTIGFAPGQPYLGQLDRAWDIPRMQKLNPQVPRGALVVAIRQLIVFAGPAPTGWRHIGQTAFHCFRPDAGTPIALNVGDEVSFDVVRTLDGLAGNGGATAEAIR